MVISSPRPYYERYLDGHGAGQTSEVSKFSQETLSLECRFVQLPTTRDKSRGCRLNTKLRASTTFAKLGINLHSS